MKLSREGAARLGHHEARGFPVSDFEFRPEDFKGCFHFGKDHIALTVEEAKVIAVTMFAYHELCQKFLIGDDNFVIKSSKVSHNLDKKIEKVEERKNDNAT